jgi:hypothetical protein
MLHLSFVIPLHKSAPVVPFDCVDADDVVSVDGVTGVDGVPPKKNHALIRIIAPGINILNTILFTILYWKLRADDIFTILLYIIPNILFS